MIMQLTHVVKASPIPDLVKRSAVLWWLFARVTDVVMQVGSIMLALGCTLLCLLVVFPCMFLITVGAHLLSWPLWPLEWA